MAARSSTDEGLHRILARSVKCFIKDDGMRLAAALAFYASFSLAPLMISAVAIAGKFYGTEAARGAVGDQLQQHFGESAEILERSLPKTENISMSLVGLLLSLLGAAGVFAQIQAALNTIWQAEEPRSGGVMGFVRNRALSFFMVVVSGFLLLASMFLSSLLSAFEERTGDIMGLPIGAWVAGSGVVSFLILTLLLSAIFKLLPDTHIRWRDVWVGAAFTALLFTLGKHAVAWYIGRQAGGSNYGSAASITVVLTWLYYTAITFLLGAEFTECHARSRNPVRQAKEPARDEPKPDPASGKP